MPISITTTGNTSKVEEFLKKMIHGDIFSRLDRYGQEGVSLLSAATPRESGLTAASWYYEITRSGSSYTIEWLNHNVQSGVNIAILIQYGHGTGTGGYVAPRDYINPVIKPLFDRIKADIWREVRNA